MREECITVLVFQTDDLITVHSLLGKVVKYENDISFLSEQLRAQVSGTTNMREQCMSYGPHLPYGVSLICMFSFYRNNYVTVETSLCRHSIKGFANSRLG